MKVEESLNVTFDETPPPPKNHHGDDELVKEEASEFTLIASAIVVLLIHGMLYNILGSKKQTLLAYLTTESEYVVTEGSQQASMVKKLHRLWHIGKANDGDDVLSLEGNEKPRPSTDEGNGKKSMNLMDRILVFPLVGSEMDEAHASRIGPVAYRLRLSEELSGVHDTFHVSNLKKCLADASLHVPLDEIKVDKTPRFVEEPVEIMDCEIKSLKRVGSIFLNETLIYCQLCGI
ncbi:hypothetical protein Tco_0378352 [Tanacetum coccineum]